MSNNKADNRNVSPYFQNAEKLLNDLKEIRKKSLNKEQRKIFKHGDGPMWIIAGPGSGKSEILCWRCLKLLLVDNIPSESIFLTTFTEKAADNLKNRINDMIIELERLRNHKLDVDIQKLLIGTLHGLCNRILQEYKYPDYENKRLMDEFEQIFFISRHCDFVNSSGSKRRPGMPETFWEFFHLKSFKRFDRIKSAVKLLDRVVEDYLILDKLKNSNRTELQQLHDMYFSYIDSSL